MSDGYIEFSSDDIEWPRCECLMHSPDRRQRRFGLSHNANQLNALFAKIAIDSNYCGEAKEMFAALLLYLNAIGVAGCIRAAENADDARNMRYAISNAIDCIYERAKLINAQAGEAWQKQFSR